MGRPSAAATPTLTGNWTFPMPSSSSSGVSREAGSRPASTPPTRTRMAAMTSRTRSSCSTSSSREGKRRHSQAPRNAASDPGHPSAARPISACSRGAASGTISSIAPSAPVGFDSSGCEAYHNVVSTMLRIMLSVLLSAQLPAGKELPPYEEPDWTAWETVDSQAVEKATLAWRDALRAKLSPDDTEDPATLIAKELRGWETLGYDTAAACDAGKKILRSSQNDLERIWIGSLMAEYGKEKGLPFLAW